MNFFGHAALAARRSTEPAFVLGAMVPDFATMLHARVPETSHERLAAGIALHHRTDAAFHDGAIFRRLSGEAFRALEERGLRRGSSRAVAHIGLEILLDGELARDAARHPPYLAALEAGAGGLGAHLAWADPDAPARFVELCAGLARRGAGPDGFSADALARRLEYALARRPLLALDEPHARAVVVAWADRFAERVRHVAPAWLADVEAGLGG